MALSGRPNNTTAVTLSNDGFWPDMTLGDLLDKYRVSAEYADDVVKEGLKNSMVIINDRLKKVKAEAIVYDFLTLEAYCDTFPNAIDGEHVLHFHYIRAVCCHAKAYLLQNAQTLNRKPSAENMAKESDDTQAYWLMQSDIAVGQIIAEFFPDDDQDPSQGRVTLL